MAKRFTDTDKWKNPWWNKLPLKAKVVWLYLTDNCDHAGIWPVDLSLMSYHLGESVTKEELENWFTDKLFWINDAKLYITTFIDFQYKGALKPGNKCHDSVLVILSSNQIKWAPKALASPCLGVKDKDKEKDKVMDKEKDQDKEGAESLTVDKIRELIASSLN